MTVSCHRFAGIARFVLLFLALSLLTRIVLTVMSWSDLDHGVTLPGAYLAGFLYDLATSTYFAVPVALWFWLCPSRWWKARWHRFLLRAAVGGFIFLMGFVGLSEVLFWQEFGCRFNFIAVDYLIYTTEVVRNINESYNMPLLLGSVAALAGLIYGLLCFIGFFRGWLESETPLRGRWKPALGCLALTVLVGFTVKQNQLPEFDNNFNREIGCNGPFAFFAAYHSNELDYEKNYPRRELAEVSSRLKNLVVQPGQKPVEGATDPLSRLIPANGPERRLNVVQITVESLSGEFLGRWGNTQGLTPFLDGMTKQSVFFSHIYATGTRTVRGMEALTLCIPPTPGQAIVRRPKNEDLFTLGSVLKGRGYDCTFLYGGVGFFDNMNAYFEANHYQVHDRHSMAPGDVVTMENAWGACDGDVYNWALAEADRSYAAGKNFHHFIMTTSNHRPYTFPEGTVKFPQGTREGVVAYTDYAIQKFIEAARTKPWFKDTVFVMVADHCHGSARKAELEVRKYEIPCFLYSPGHLEPRVVETLCSQIDVAPTVLGLMGVPYESRFFGGDVLAPGFKPRAFVSNYQKVGYMTETDLVVLKPLRQFSHYTCNRITGFLTPLKDGDPAVVEDAISYYQGASWMFKTGLYRSGLNGKTVQISNGP